MQLRKLIPLMLLIISLIYCFCSVYAEEAVLETKFHLDTGAYFIWGVGSNSESWPKGIYNRQISHTLECGINMAVNRDPRTIKVISVTPYNGYNFNFHKPEQYTWNSTYYATNQQSYDENYMLLALSNMNSFGSPNYDDMTGKLVFGYSGTLMSNRRSACGGEAVNAWDEMSGDLNVKSIININHDLIEIERWMGSIPDETRIPMQEMLDNPDNDALQGFLYFAPMVIEYQIIDPIPLISPMVLLDCKAGSMFIGLQTPVRGSILNRNEKPVITYYTLTVNGSKVLQSGCVLQDGGKSKKVDSSYTIPGNTKPGTQFVFKLEARQTWAYDAPNRYLPEEESRPREVNPEYEPFINSHTYVSAVNAWYKNDGPWVTGEAVCRKSAVLLPEAPLNHEMNPSVIVE